MATQITLPRDAEGREIPLDTEVLYDKNGQEIEVSRYQYYPKAGPGYWNLKSVRNKYYRQDEVYLTKPDSWKRLLDDLDNAAEEASNNYVKAPCCAWFNGGDSSCTGCPADESPRDSCNVQLVKNIAARIRRLRGEDE